MSNIPIDNDDNDFVLKHRIAGAAFLLFFGALVLPWLLGAPTDAKKIEPTDVAQPQKQTEEYVPEDLENEVLTQLKDEVEADEKVYISKVTPTGFTQVGESSTSAADKKAEAEKLAKEKAETEAANKKAQEKAEALAKANQNKDQEKKAELERQKQAKLAKGKADVEAAKVAAAEQAPKTTEKAAESTSNIKSGWIVQVGVFTDKSGADKISKSLKDKGFESSSSTVDTNKGPNTGTRVWLGPYRDRAQATKAKTNLADKTGTSGFIRAYP